MVKKNPKYNPEDFSLELEKECCDCKESKTLDFFHIERTGKYARSGVCKDCKRWRYIKFRHNISKEKFMRILQAQHGLCPIGGEKLELDKKICVDHDHSCCIGSRTCGECIRGLLCDKCNRGLAHFEDNPAYFRNAIMYLEKKNWGRTEEENAN